MSLGDLNKWPWESYLEGGGLQCEEIIKSTLFCKVHYVLNSDIKNFLSVWISTGIAVLFGKAVCFLLPLLLSEESQELRTDIENRTFSYATASISYAALQRSYVES
jgi:hypothetical protein